MIGRASSSRFFVFVAEQVRASLWRISRKVKQHNFSFKASFDCRVFASFVILAAQIKQPVISLTRRRRAMPKKRPEEFEYLSNNPDFVPDPEIEEFMEEEIARAPKDPDHLAQRLRNN